MQAVTESSEPIQVDFDQLASGKFHGIDIPVWDEIGVTVAILRERLAGRRNSEDPRREVADRWKIWREEKLRREDDDLGNGLNSASIYLGSIDFGHPAGMDAWAAAPDRPTVVVTSDGGFGQYMGELLTAVKYGMNITHVLVNNSQLGKISKEQRAGEWDVWQTSLHNPDFSKYAEICGALGIRVTRRGELDEALQRALAHDGPAMVEIVADAELI